MNQIKKEDIHDNYVFDRPLGDGVYAQVYRAYHRDNDQVYAIKQIDKEKVPPSNLIKIQHEYELLASLEHPNIIRVYEAYENSKYFWIVMEYMQGGELCDWIHNFQSSDEVFVCNIIKILNDALEYCHSQDIIHRDLKPENILVSTNNEDAVIKIVDFGMARIVGDNLLTTVCGNPSFYSPELLNCKQYGKEVDYWSLGVLMYILLSGNPPFRGPPEVVVQRIKNCAVAFPQEDWKHISSSAKDLICHLLTKDPQKRYTATQVRNHPWIVSGGVKREHPQLGFNIQRFNVQRRLQKMQSQIKYALQSEHPQEG